MWRFPISHTHFQVGVLRVPVLQPILSVNADPEGQHLQSAQQQLGAGAQGTRPPGKAPKRLRYYARLSVNGRPLDSSEEVAIDDEFVVNFKDTFRFVAIRVEGGVSSLTRSLFGPVYKIMTEIFCSPPCYWQHSSCPLARIHLGPVLGERHNPRHLHFSGEVRLVKSRLKNDWHH